MYCCCRLLTCHADVKQRNMNITGHANRFCVETSEGRGTWQAPNMMGCVTKAFVDVKEKVSGTS